MPNKRQSVNKTEEQLKQESHIRRENEARLAAMAAPKSSFALKLENFWYHYKWHAVIGTATLITAAFFINDMLFRVKPDATIVMITEEYFPAESVGLMSEKLGRIASDFNGDDRVVVIVDTITLPDNIDAPVADQIDYANAMKLSTVLAAGTDPIYILDEAAYQYITSMNMREGDVPGTDNFFCEESVSAAVLELPEFSDMGFYLRQGLDKDEKYYHYCEKLMGLLQVAG